MIASRRPPEPDLGNRQAALGSKKGSRNVMIRTRLSRKSDFQAFRAGSRPDVGGGLGRLISNILPRRRTTARS
ncbi:MAG: hypothetical protein CMJ27_02100 [Phycisphaerae bacterium]|nr:hypothetical protein [Phycisphaerae bacterium]